VREENKKFLVGDIVSWKGGGDSWDRHGIILATNNSSTKSIILWFEEDDDTWYSNTRLMKIRAVISMRDIEVVGVQS